MAQANLARIVCHCQKTLRRKTFSDWDGAVNGLQVENSGAVTCIAAAVDASLATIKLAIAARADLMIVHHGLFWKKHFASPGFFWTTRRDYEGDRRTCGAECRVDECEFHCDA